MTEKKKLISDRLLDEGDNFILVFASESGTVGAQQVPVGRGFFFKVLSWDLFRYEYTGVAALNAVTGVTYNYLGTTSHGVGNDIMRIKDDEWWLYHFGYSVPASTIRVYRRLSGRMALGGMEYNSADEPDPTVGADYGYVLGSEIDNLYDPPAYTETICWYTGKVDTPLWEWGFYNESATLRQPIRMILTGRQYKMIPITRKDVQDALIAGRIPRTVLSVGGLRITAEESFIPDDWKGFCERKVAFTDLTGVVCEI